MNWKLSLIVDNIKNAPFYSIITDITHARYLQDWSVKPNVQKSSKMTMVGQQKFESWKYFWDFSSVSCICPAPVSYLASNHCNCRTVLSKLRLIKNYLRGALWGKVVCVRWLYSALKLCQQNLWKLRNLSTIFHLLKHARRNFSNDSSDCEFDWLRSSKWTECWWL